MHGLQERSAVASRRLRGSDVIVSTRRIRDLLAELRRRHVFRVAAVYAAAAFVVLQVADIAFPALNLPQWATTLVVVIAALGFPVAIVVGWMLEWSAPAIPVPLQDASRATPDRVVLAVMPFNVGGRQDFQYLSEGMVDILSSKLRSGDVRPVDPHTLLGLGARQVGTARDPAGARRVAERCDADLFVLGNIVEAGGYLHTDAALYATGAQLSLVAEATAEGAAGDLFSLVDELARQLLAGLTTGPGARLTRLAMTMTGSFDALKAYLEGEREMRAMRRIPAVEAYRVAVDRDPEFALAWYRLAVASLWSGQLERSRDAIERAVELGVRLSDHDRMLVVAFRAFLRGQAEDAEHLYRVVVGSHPDDLEAWYQLAEVLFHYGPLRGHSLLESRAAWERTLSLEPEHMSALTHLAVIAAADGKRSEVGELVRRATAISPAGDAVTWMLALQAWEASDATAQAEVVARLRSASDFAVARAAWYVSVPGKCADGPKRLAALLTEAMRAPEVRAVGHLWIGHLELAGGHLRAALAEIARARSLHHPAGFVHGAQLALVPVLETRRDEIMELRTSLEGWNAEEVPQSMIAGDYFTVHNGLYPQLRTYLLGLVAARLGDAEAARGYARSLEEWSGRPEAADLAADQARSVLATLAWSAGRKEEALDLLEASCMGALFELTMASPFFSQARERWLRAELLAASGREEEALQLFGSFTGHSIYDLIYRAPSHDRRGRIFEETGRPAEAARHYRRFLELWSDADAELQPWRQRAKARLAALGEPD